MTDPIRVKTRSIQDLRRWIITQGQFSPCGTELLECLMHIDYLKASQPSAMNLEQTTFGIAEALPPSDQEIEEWADQSDLIPDEELVCDEQWQRCFLPEQFYATIRAALARWGSLAGTLLHQPAPAVLPVPVAERPWERDGWCDADGRCWWSHGPTPTAGWSLLPMDGMDDARGWLLPHCAIPIPQPPHSAEMQP